MGSPPTSSHLDDDLQKNIKKPMRYFLIIRTFYRYGYLYYADFQ